MGRAIYWFDSGNQMSNQENWTKILSLVVSDLEIVSLGSSLLYDIRRQIIRVVNTILILKYWSKIIFFVWCSKNHDIECLCPDTNEEICIYVITILCETWLSQPVWNVFFTENVWNMIDLNSLTKEPCIWLRKRAIDSWAKVPIVFRSTNWFV